MTNAEKILTALDEELTSRIDLTLYGRAALHLGFPQSPKEHGLSHDVDAVFWVGQAEELNEKSNFWTNSSGKNLSNLSGVKVAGRTGRVIGNVRLCSGSCG